MADCKKKKKKKRKSKSKPCSLLAGFLLDLSLLVCGGMRVRQRVRSTKGARHVAGGKEKKEMKVKEVREREREDGDERDDKKFKSF
jgi:hypothetical protein